MERFLDVYLFLDLERFLDVDLFLLVLEFNRLGVRDLRGLRDRLLLRLSTSFDLSLLSDLFESSPAVTVTN